jgi:sugar lactone lactonase YvrE
MNEVLRVPAAELATSGDKSADALFTAVTDPDGLAFDSDGNLWVGGGPTLLRFDAARLGEVDEDPADLELTVTSAMDENLGLQGPFPTFDGEGNLWSIDLGTNMVFQVPVASLDGTGVQSVQAAVSFAVDIGALPEGLAFDDGGGLWLNLQSGASGGNFGRFSPEQLTMSTGTGDPVVPDTLITSASIGTGLPPAFFPAPEGLPLFHSLPAP